jgi:hypothetical protein
MLKIQEIDHLTEKFYDCISFNAEHYPKFDQLQELFYGAGKLINTNFDTPLDFTVQSYAQAIMHQIDEGNSSFYFQQEISDSTEIFGNIAQRISVYEYSFAVDTPQPWKRGVNYIQYMFLGGKWLITSMIWADEKAGSKIPEDYLL